MSIARTGSPSAKIQAIPMLRSLGAGATGPATEPDPMGDLDQHESRRRSRGRKPRLG